MNYGRHNEYHINKQAKLVLRGAQAFLGLSAP